MDKKVGIISDIHSNAVALNIALKELVNQKVDLCVILGDLLTYGTEPNKVIELLLDFKNTIQCIFIKGNHEEFYFDIANKIDPIKYKMPKFVQESIFWTNNKLKYDLYGIFDWHEEFTIDKIYFAHANPFEYGNWIYMNKEQDIKNAMISLKKKNMSVGIFGHTHRDKRYIVSNDFNECKVDLNNKFKFNNKEYLILNAGSIGQPRGSYPNFMILNITDNLIKYDNIKVDIDNKLLINKMLKTNLSKETKDKLNSFWEIKND